MKPKIVCVVPSIRPDQCRTFIGAWKALFEKHHVVLITVWDGETPHVDIWNYSTGKPVEIKYNLTLYQTYKRLIYRYTDACRNLGFIIAAHLNPDYVLTLDDDVTPIGKSDPIQEHLDVLQKKVPLDWMNTAHGNSPYLRGMPYNNRNEAPVMLSHGVWVGVPDFDGETQLKLEEETKGDYIKPDGTKATSKLPSSLPYYIGPIPKGVLFPLCGMNVMIRKEALPYFYFAPMGPDTKIDNLNRFSDIWMGIYLKKKFDELGWACYTGGATILHTRASNAQKNFEQEKLGREWNEWFSSYDVYKPFLSTEHGDYMIKYYEKRLQYQSLISSILLKNK